MRFDAGRRLLLDQLFDAVLVQPTDVVENFMVEAAGGIYAKFACSFSGLFGEREHESCTCGIRAGETRPCQSAVQGREWADTA
ncbi:Uncharacterised protein [Mycobacterium tuberculosis]|nr:Uncharacterised protein [Mycobacterium tuberculosis]